MKGRRRRPCFSTENEGACNKTLHFFEKAGTKKSLPSNPGFPFQKDTAQGKMLNIVEKCLIIIITSNIRGCFQLQEAKSGEERMLCQI